MSFYDFKISSVTAFAAALVAATGVSPAQTVFNFEQPTPLNSPLVSGDVSRFAVTTEQAHNGSQALRFADATLEPYESWTYDLPFDLTSGTVTLWFYDKLGADAIVNHGAGTPRWGGSIILEDKNNPADFGAVEIAELPYGPKYYASEGLVNRGVAGSDQFDANSLPLRAVGFHKVEFHVTASETLIYVDGLTADEVAGPGSTGINLRLRFMADSPSNGGRGGETWHTHPSSESRGKLADWIYYDDITIAAQTPAVQSHRLDFELNGETPDYDSTGEFQGPNLPSIDPNDNPYMEDFVNQWEVLTSSTVAHSGTGAATFANPPAPWKSVAFDLSGAAPGTSITLWFYDSAGQSGSYDNAKAASVIIEEGGNAGNFHAVEITSLPFPYGVPSRTYYLTVGEAAHGGSGTLYSKGLGARSIGWHKVEIGLYPTYSEIVVDGQTARYIASGQSTGAIAKGPGLDKLPKLRIMGDSASGGGLSNYTTLDPLNASTFATREPFAYFDDISIPVSNAGVNDWMTY